MSDYSPKAALQTIRTIHFAILAAPLLFGGAVIFLVTGNQIDAPNENKVLLYLPAAQLLLSFPLAWMVFKNMLKSNLKKDANLQSRLSVFQTTHLVRMAVFEAAGLVACVVCMITGTLFNLVIVAVVALVFLKHAPSVYSLEIEIGLTPEEKAAFQ